VRINDRGPFVPGRSLDLWQRAAERIGVIHKGIAKVKISSAAAPAQDFATHTQSVSSGTPGTTAAQSGGANDYTVSKAGK
jgi:rare lipoprotein A